MARSQAQKQRNKLVREGYRNPKESRGIYALADMRTRKTKTKKDKMYQEKHKGRSSFQNGNYERPLCFSYLKSASYCVGEAVKIVTFYSLRKR
ncbi:hypothetical protein HNQ94_001201 [Salirhabdus euzebyi]|uniref:Uncharacterized protein n=1 Tax=Salirhabdus euzebyi TaxID=394506 RepID=A0A841Q2L1_9BACI|nr:hypothetical protein [Salirhabdus euzebyi]MBB6452755.1 hypothetical protein [Salirhabdus euzebyi]